MVGTETFNYYFKNFTLVPRKLTFFQLKQMGIIHQHNFLSVRLFDYMGITTLNNVNETATLPQLRNFDFYYFLKVALVYLMLEAF